MIGLHAPKARLLGESTFLLIERPSPVPWVGSLSAACSLGLAVGLQAGGLHEPRARRRMIIESKPWLLTKAEGAAARASGVTCTARLGWKCPEPRWDRGAFGRDLS